MRGYVVVLLGIMAAFTGGLLALPAEPAADALVKVGEIYQVAWTCLPQIGCYAEALKVEKIRSDGWTDVFQCQEPSCKEGERWTVNLQNAYAIRPFPPVGKAAN